MILVYIIAFFVGTIPFSKLYNLFQKRTTAHKVTQVISENIKLHFMLDSWIGVLIYLFSFLKVFIFLRVVVQINSPELIPAIISAAALILGDCYSPFDKKNKSKGILSALAVYTALCPTALLFLVIGYLICLVYIPYRFIAFTIVSALLPFLLFLTGYSTENIILALIIFIITTLRLVPNIKNYLEKSEPTIKKEFLNRNK